MGSMNASLEPKLDWWPGGQAAREPAVILHLHSKEKHMGIVLMTEVCLQRCCA